MQPLFGAFEYLKCKLVRISALCGLSLNPEATQQIGHYDGALIVKSCALIIFWSESSRPGRI